MKKLVNYIILAVIIFIACIALLEVGTRFFIEESNPKNKLYFVSKKNNLKIGPKNIKLRQIKNTDDYNVEIKFNEHGFRDQKDFTKSNDEDFFIVGDSMSFGWGVEEEERYSNVLENFTNKKIFNICIPGDLNNYIRLLNFVEKKNLNISNLIIGFTMENDFANYTDIPKDKIINNEKIIEESSRISKIKHYLTRNSSFYFILTREVHKNELLRNFFIKINLINPNLENIYYTKYSDSIINSTVTKLIEITDKYKSLVIIIPSRALWYGKHKDEADKIHKKFLKLLEKKKVKFIDLRKDFEENGNPLGYHFKRDGHWNRLGHQLAAKIIFEKYFKSL